MYVLHYVPDWASFVIHAVLEELGVPYRLVLVNPTAGGPAAGGLDSPAFRALNPMGKIPVLETPDGVMIETAAMLLYLAERHHALAPEPNSAGRAMFLKWFVFTNNSVHTTVMDLVHPDYPAGEAVAPMVSATAHARLKSQLAVLNAMVVADAPWWLSADQPSVLSFYLPMLLRWAAAFAAMPEHQLKARDYPALQAICAATETRAAVQRAALVEGLSGTFLSNPALSNPEA